jgi:hypothetical protein
MTAIDTNTMSAPTTDNYCFKLQCLIAFFLELSAGRPVKRLEDASSFLLCAAARS